MIPDLNNKESAEQHRQKFELLWTRRRRCGTNVNNDGTTTMTTTLCGRQIDPNNIRKALERSSIPSLGPPLSQEVDIQAVCIKALASPRYGIGMLAIHPTCRMNVTLG